LSILINPSIAQPAFEHRFENITTIMTTLAQLDISIDNAALVIEALTMHCVTTRHLDNHIAILITNKRFGAHVTIIVQFFKPSHF
jgi:hypothetical protein